MLKHWQFHQSIWLEVIVWKLKYATKISTVLLTLWFWCEASELLNILFPKVPLLIISVTDLSRVGYYVDQSDEFSSDTICKSPPMNLSGWEALLFKFNIQISPCCKLADFHLFIAFNTHDKGNKTSLHLHTTYLSLTVCFKIISATCCGKKNICDWIVFCA